MTDFTPGTLSVNLHRISLAGADDPSIAPPIVLPLPLPDPNPTLEPTLYITDDLLFNFQRCSRRAYLDLHTDASHRDPPSDYLLKLRQDSIAHQLAILADHPAYRPDYPAHDWTAGSMATLALMEQGVDYITRGVLRVVQEDGVALVSCPDLLVKQPGRSRFGDWLYVPTEIKLGKRPKLDYQITAAFHAYVLAIAQGTWSHTAWLILRQRHPYAIDLPLVFPKMQAVLDECIATLRQDREPEVFIAHSRCDLCHWYSHCYQLAQSEQHLSLLPGVTPSRYIHLKQLQITTVESLAETPPQQLELLPGFGSQVAQKLVIQAQSKLQDQAIARVPDSHRASPLLLTDEELPTQPIELYFDIEAAPEQNLVYLHGVLVVDRQASTETFHALVADAPDQEADIWRQFLDLVWQHPTAPIFHFCPYEVQTVKRLADYYNTPLYLIDPLVERFVDLHERVTRVATLPIESYALKPIARWLGFNWRDPDANGAQSIYWYAQWLKTGDRAFLDAILRYNEDDCRATYRVKDWLADFVRQSNPSPLSA